MAKSVNKVILIGNLGKDPELRVTPNGVTVANFTLATNERTKDNNGQWQDRTEWHNLVAWQRTAEIAREYLKKGSKIYVEGSLRTRSWDDKNTGEKRYRTEIWVNDLVLLSGRGEGESTVRAAAAGNNFDQRAPEPEPAPAHSGGITDEDIPF
ncbi:MAG TPA: single-stranded DNA-binding protein [Terriglobales bacterium]|jgi:single-strand DNA-binding protein|nr:single-stranded DNA-binding protein [Terriglobales bacterium]